MLLHRPIGAVSNCRGVSRWAGKVLPAGSYVVELDKTVGYIELHNKTDFARLNLGAASTLRDGKDEALKGRLAFHPYGTVLKKIWMEGEIRGAVLPASMAEREMTKTAAAKEVIETSQWSALKPF